MTPHAADDETPTPSTTSQIAGIAAATERIRTELGKVIVGQHRVIDELLIALLTGGHALVVGVPGLAKTLLVRSLSKALGLTFNRIQFTPDLMPADVTGTEVIQEDRTTGQRQLRFIPGPVFANILLADEINRTPPKTQAALLEAMQEHQVTVGGQRHPLPEPFFVLATENPIEQEGTYPLPEAQLDRFLLEIHVDYPEEEDEFQIVRRTTAASDAVVRQVLSHEELTRHQRAVLELPMADHDVRYAMALVRASRPKGDVPDFIKKYVTWGAGPRGTQSVVLAAKAHAAMQGRVVATSTDIRNVLAPVLRHRLVLNFSAESDGLTPDDVVQNLIEVIPVPGSTGVMDRLMPFWKKGQGTESRESG